MQFTFPPIHSKTFVISIFQSLSMGRPILLRRKGTPLNPKNPTQVRLRQNKAVLFDFSPNPGAEPMSNKRNSVSRYHSSSKSKTVKMNASNHLSQPKIDKFYWHLNQSSENQKKTANELNFLSRAIALAIKKNPRIDGCDYSVVWVFSLLMRSYHKNICIASHT